MDFEEDCKVDEEDDENDDENVFGEKATKLMTITLINSKKLSHFNSKRKFVLLF